MQEHLHVGRAGAPIPMTHQLLSHAGRAAGRDQPISSLHRHSGGSWAGRWECRGWGGVLLWKDNAHVCLGSYLIILRRNQSRC